MMASRSVDNLIKKWGSNDLGKLSISSLKDPYLKENMAILLQNQDNPEAVRSILETSTASTTNSFATTNDTAAGAFQPIAMALVRRTFPELFANKVVGVQAMTGPVGLAYAMRFLYNTTASPRDEAAFNKVDSYSGYSGSISGTSGTADTGTGVSTATGESWQIGGSLPTGKYPELALRIDRQAVTANTRKLAASFSLEAAQDIKAMHGVDVEREMVNVLQYEIMAELDRELLYNMKVQAEATANGGATAKAYDVSAADGVLGHDGRWSQEKYQNIVTQIIQEANNIAIYTRRGAGNFVVVSPRVATALQSSGPAFSRNTALVNPTSTFAEIGTINGTITVYRDTYATSDYALVGFKGPGIADAGIIFSPYVMGLTNRAISPDDFAPRVGVMSRYAITNSLLGAGRYYRLVNFTNLNLFIG